MKAEQKSSKEPMIIKYTNILHEYGVGLQEAINFREQYKDDMVFQCRAGVLELLIDNKNI